MRDDSGQLTRLMQAAAAQAREEHINDEIPVGFQTRVIAHWLSQSEDFTLTLFRRALPFAFGLVLVSFALSYPTLVSSPSAELAVANNALEVNFTP